MSNKHGIDDVQEIRRLLDEHGVDYDEHSRNSSHVFEIDYCDACADYLGEIEIFSACIYATKKYCTPEQAIAATLGSELNPDGLPVGLTISEDGELLNWRGENYVKQSTLGSGTLTGRAEGGRR